MKRKTITLTCVAVALALAGAGFFLNSNDIRPASSEATQSSRNEVQAPSSNGEAHHRSDAAAGLVEKHSAPISARTDAEAAYELLDVNLRCQIDREAAVGGGHIPSTTEELCSDLSLKPLSREEIFKAITYAAENGSIKAQLDYASYASRIFEDEKYALDTELIREYKENTVKFLEAAGRSGEPHAYVRLSDIYKDGALTPKDPVMAYAYAEAYVRTGSSRYGASFLSNASSGLDGAQLRRGKEIANQILNKGSSSK
jgi:hypothetical protein